MEEERDWADDAADAAIDQGYAEKRLRQRIATALREERREAEERMEKWRVNYRLEQTETASLRAEVERLREQRNVSRSSYIKALLGEIDQLRAQIAVLTEGLETYANAEDDYQRHLEHQIPEIKRAAIVLARYRAISCGS